MIATTSLPALNKAWVRALFALPSLSQKARSRKAFVGPGMGPIETSYPSANQAVCGSHSISRRTHRLAPVDLVRQRLGWSWHRYTLSLVLSCLLCVSFHFTVVISSFSIFNLIFIIFIISFVYVQERFYLEKKEEKV